MTEAVAPTEYAPDAPVHHTRIEPAKGWMPIRVGELWEYRELLYFLTWRDIKVRYKQTGLGAAWAILQPVGQMVVFTLFVSLFAGYEPVSDLPYPITNFTALIPWTFFAYAISQSSASMVSSSNLITKVYCPRLIIPIASVLSGLVDFALSFLVLIGMMFWYGIAPTPNVFFLIPLVGLVLIAGLAVGIWLAALNVTYRDVRYIVPFLTNMLLFTTPVAYEYPAEAFADLGGPWEVIYNLNPMVGVVEGFRWALLDGGHAPGVLTLASLVVSTTVLVAGAFYFRRMERTFADRI